MGICPGSHKFQTNYRVGQNFWPAWELESYIIAIVFIILKNQRTNHHATKSCQILVSFLTLFPCAAYALLDVAAFLFWAGRHPLTGICLRHLLTKTLYLWRGNASLHFATTSWHLIVIRLKSANSILRRTYEFHFGHDSFSCNTRRLLRERLQLRLGFFPYSFCSYMCVYFYCLKY
jgi:hypothetical protein